MYSFFRSIIFGSLSFLISCEPYHNVPPLNEKLNFEKLGVSFENLNETILIPKCLYCHQNANQNNHFVDLSSYEKIVSGNVFPPLVVEGNPEESSLYSSVRDSRMPVNNPRLRPQEIEYLRVWILLGAKKENVTVEEVPITKYY